MALAPATVQRMPGALEPCGDLLAAGLDDARRDAQAPGPELRIAHAMAVPADVVYALARWRRGIGKRAQRGDEGKQPSGVQLGTPVLGPPLGQVGAGPVDGVGHVAKVLLGMVDVDDFDGAGTLFGRQVPDPGTAVADDDAPGRGVDPRRIASR